MVRNLNQNRVLWLIIALLALVASVTGVISPGIYARVVVPEIMPGVLSQDLMTILASIIILALLARIHENEAVKQLIILGIVAYLFYAYGIYVIERVYNALYLIYMAVFGLAFYSMITTVAGIRSEARSLVRLPKGIRITAVVLSLLQPIVFYPLWISMLLPLMQTGQQTDSMYSIFIIDLCFIMPAFIIVAARTIRQNGLGLLLTPAMFVLGFTLLFPVGMGELLKPLVYQLPMDTGGLALYLTLSAVFFSLAVACLRNLRFGEV